MRRGGKALADIEGRIRHVLRLVTVVAALHHGAAHRHAKPERVGQRSRCDRLDLGLLRLDFIGGSGHELFIVGGIRRSQRNHAGGGVFAEEQGLRAFQDLELTQVEESLLDDAALTVVNTIHDHGDRLFDADRRRRGADAAQSELGAGTVGCPANRKIRRHGRDFLQAGQIFPPDRVAADCRDVDRHVLRTLRAFACGHHDVLESPLIRGFRLCGALCPSDPSRCYRANQCCQCATHRYQRALPEFVFHPCLPLVQKRAIAELLSNPYGAAAQPGSGRMMARHGTRRDLREVTGELR